MIMIYILFYLDPGFGWQLENVFYVKESAEQIGERSGNTWKVEEYQVL